MKIVHEVKDIADTLLKIRLVQNIVAAAYTNLSLSGSEGELIPDDDALKGYNKHKLHSQSGSFLLLMNKDHLDDVGDVRVIFADWRTRALRTVLA